MYNLNTFKNAGSAKVLSTVAINQWFDSIKNNIYQSLIEEARELKQSLNDTQQEIVRLKASKIKKSKIEILKCTACKIKAQYDSKKLQLPTIAYNTTFKSYRNTKNVVSTTGLMYLDVDTDGFDIEKIDKSKLFCYYKSVGGLGYTILVKVRDLTIDNYSSTFESVIDNLGIRDFYDKAAKGLVQQSILSYDPNIYINYNSYVFQSIDIIEKKTQPLCNNQKKEEHIVSVGSKIIRYNNLYDFDFDGWDTISNWNEGFDYVECFQPFNKLTDKRKRTLLSYTTNLVWLNPSLDYYHYINLIQSVNEQICVEPLPDNLIVSMVKSVLKQKNEGKLVPRIKKRRILFAPFCELSREQKLKIVSKKIRDKFKVEGCGRIDDCIEEWNFESMGKITAKSIAQYAKMNIKTVKKYYYKFKSNINSLNADNNQIKTKKRVKIVLLERAVCDNSTDVSAKQINVTEDLKIVKTQYCDLVIRDYNNALKLVKEAGASENDLIESVQDNFDKVFLTNLKIKYLYDLDVNEDYVLICVA